VVFCVDCCGSPKFPAFLSTLSFPWLVGLHQGSGRVPVSGSIATSSPSETLTGSCRSASGSGLPLTCPRRSSHEVHRRSPPPFVRVDKSPRSIVRPLPICPKTSLWSEVATPRTRSVLAVPPGFDGFLRSMACRFVAPCFRPWGPPSFPRCLPPVPVSGLRFRRRVSRRRCTLQSFSLSGSSSHITRGLLPLRASLLRDSLSPLVRPLRAGSSCHRSGRLCLCGLVFPRPQGVVPPGSPLSSLGCFHLRMPDALLGLCSRFLCFCGKPLPLRRLDVHVKDRFLWRLTFR